MVWEFTLVLAILSFGIAVGMFVARRYYKNDKTEASYGVLNVDCSDPADGPYLYLDLTVPIAEVADCKQVTFNVNVIPNISQK